MDEATDDWTPTDEWMVPLTDPPTVGPTSGKTDGPAERQTTGRMIGPKGGRTYQQTDNPADIPMGVWMDEPVENGQARKWIEGSMEERPTTDGYSER